MGIEPTFSAWEADVLPLNYTRMYTTSGICPMVHTGKIIHGVVNPTITAYWQTWAICLCPGRTLYLHIIDLEL